MFETENILLKNMWKITVNFQADNKDTGIDYIETWRGMEGVLKANLARSIGVSNFNEEQLERLLQHATVKPVCNQFEVIIKNQL